MCDLREEVYSNKNNNTYNEWHLPMKTIFYYYLFICSTLASGYSHPGILARVSIQGKLFHLIRICLRNLIKSSALMTLSCAIVRAGMGGGGKNNGLN